MQAIFASQTGNLPAWHPVQERNLAKLPRHVGAILLFCGLSLLAACAATPRHTLAAASGPTATPNGALVTGVVVAIRPVAGNAALSSGAAEVLAALQIPAPAQAPNATEFVIQRDDGGVASVVLPSPVSSPTASMSASDFSVGDHVELLTGDQTELIHPP